jgi:hypothetical protein
VDRRFCDKNAQNHNKAWHTQHSAKFASSGKKERRLRNHVFKRLSKDLIALNWSYEGNHPFARECKLMAAQKIPFYVCPGTSSWNSLTGRTTNMQTNLANAARQGKKYGADGYLVTDWGDYGHHQYLPVSYAGFLLGACHAWNHTGTKKLIQCLALTGDS